MIKDWKSVITAVVAALAMVLSALGIIELTPEQQAAIVTVALLIIGFFTDVTLRAMKKKLGM